MLIIYNKLIPFGEFQTIMLFGIIFTKLKNLPAVTINHESIHAVQWIECGIISSMITALVCILINFWSWWLILIPLVSWYVLYIIEWGIQAVVRIFNSQMLPYDFITFEQEAYDNDINEDYLDNRNMFAWIKYIGQWKKY